MTGASSWARGCACVVWAVSGCALETVPSEASCDGLSPGDLVITEVHANPDGPDGDGEYIELFNASGGAFELEGLRLIASRADGTGSADHRFGAAAIDSEGYVVAGNAPPDAVPAHVDYAYGKALGNLRNSDATVSLRCGDMLIDQVTYERTQDGRALELDGRIVPDHLANDDASRWCVAPEGASEPMEGNFGTPGASNSHCDEEAIDGACVDDGSGRLPVFPEVGEVQITEWMANPQGLDSDFEWVELLVHADVDLHGLQLGSAEDSLKSPLGGEGCFPVDAGTRVVFGASPAAAPRVDAELDFSLGNTGARSILVALEDTVLDRVDYDGTTEGVAWQVGPHEELCLVDAKDTALEYTPGNFGTPGEINPMCPPVLRPGMCFEDGTPRDIVFPVVGRVRITEWMANPAAVGNRQGEWVEVRFDAPADLNGLELSDLTGATTLVEDERCLPVPAGAHIVLARDPNTDENGGILHVAAELTLSLNNNDETIVLSVDGAVLDSVTYEGSTPGVATQVDEFGTVCDAVRTYGDGDFGTPGAANPACL